MTIGAGVLIVSAFAPASVVSLPAKYVFSTVVTTVSATPKSSNFVSFEAKFDDFGVALTVVTTVLNTYFAGRLTTDAGAKALTINTPAPIVIGEPGFVYDAGSDECGVSRYEHANLKYAVGDRLEVIVPHCDPAVNLYEAI